MSTQQDNEVGQGLVRECSADASQTKMYLEFYDLREPPFGVTPNPRFLYPSQTHEAALASLVCGIEYDFGFGALVAEPGLGKTTLLFRVLEYFRDSALTAFLFETQCDSTGLMRYLLKELDPEFSASEKDPVTLHERFQHLLAAAADSGRKVIVIIDEAQNLHSSVLETLRLLSNFETPHAKMMHIILAGQPRLQERLAKAGMIQLRQRISILSRLEPLAPDETARYVNHRLQVAGRRKGPLFTAAALEAIAVRSGGIPRMINHICLSALSRGCSLGRIRIDKEDVEAAGGESGAHLLALLQDPARLAVQPALETSDGIPGRGANDQQASAIASAVASEVAPCKAVVQPDQIRSFQATPTRRQERSEPAELLDLFGVRGKQRRRENRRKARAAIVNGFLRGLSRLGSLLRLRGVLTAVSERPDITGQRIVDGWASPGQPNTPKV
jgi:type II secretory pathway predicted ATPase ExeA